MDSDQRKRFKWVRLYQKLKNAGVVCFKCGISRPTLRKWVRRYEQCGIEGLSDKSRRPFTSPARKVTPQHESLIMELRNKRKLGAKRIKSELKRLHESSLSVATIHKVLRKYKAKPLSKRRLLRKRIRRYSRKVPGERVQMDVCKIAPGIYQYTAVDDCTRYKVVAIYPRRTATNSISFLEKVVEEVPFPIQRIQTDRGREFFAYKFQATLMEWGIKFRPIKPGSPHLNGKVERAQKTVLDEFYSTVDLDSADLEDKLDEWQFFYNWHRPHSALNGKTPIDKWSECLDVTPFWEDVLEKYDPTKEQFREQNYYYDLRLQKLKRSI